MSLGVEAVHPETSEALGQRRVRGCDREDERGESGGEGIEQSPHQRVEQQRLGTKHEDGRIAGGAAVPDAGGREAAGTTSMPPSTWGRIIAAYWSPGLHAKDLGSSILFPESYDLVREWV